MIKTPKNFYLELLKNFNFSPTSKQNRLLKLLSLFLFEEDKNAAFLLKGFAGTGKTTIVGLLVNNLKKIQMKSVLLAPTGRAAKVISGYAKRPAYTIHKKIYFPKTTNSGNLEFVMQKNKHTNTLFIVDEASMIPDAKQNSNLFATSSLLNDLIEYVYSGKNCKLLLIGDTAQLPPIKLDLSPALDAEELRYTYDKTVTQLELTEVMRQHKESGILINATELRGFMQNTLAQFKFTLDYPDVYRLEDGYEVEDALVDTYNRYGYEDATFIVRSNKRANLYNQQIRQNIRGLESDISAGDFIMVVKNNYYWLDDKAEAGFIANGDICKILKVLKIKELYGFRFAEVELMMVDYPNMQPFETVVLLDTLISESPSLTYEESNKLYQAVKEDYKDIRPAYKQYLEIKKNIYFNALQIKYAYAITCHKSQGGQWSTVFIEQPYLPDGVSVIYYRWLYTAITRAKENLYLIGFKDDFFTS